MVRFLVSKSDDGGKLGECSSGLLVLECLTFCITEWHAVQTRSTRECDRMFSRRVAYRARPFSPWVAGISGGPDGCYSVALSGGYEDDVDLGEAL